MTAEEALALVEATLRSSRLNQLQKTVFRFAWDDRSYGEIARQSGYELSYVKQAGSQLWQLLSRTFDEKVTKHNVQLVVQRKCNSIVKLSTQAAIPTTSIPLHSATFPYCDWGDAVDVSSFYGRETELALLERWILADRCRLVGIFGMGGIGKTSLSIRLAYQLVEWGQKNAGNDTRTQRRKDKGKLDDSLSMSQGFSFGVSFLSFQYVVWRSLRNAPPLTNLLTDLVQVLSNQQETNLPDTIDAQISRLLYYLRQQRCVILLDNGETVMQQGDPDRQTLVSGSADGMIKIWHLNRAICEQTIPAHQGPVLSIVFHPDGKIIATGSTDASIKLWDLQTGICQTLQGHDRWVKCLAYSPDGTTLASCSQDETIKLWQSSIQAEFSEPVFEHSTCDSEKELISQSRLNSTFQSAYRSSLDLLHELSHASPTCQIWQKPASKSCKIEEFGRHFQIHAGGLFFSQSLRIPRPYEGMIITSANGLTTAQQAALKLLGAVDQDFG